MKSFLIFAETSQDVLIEQVAELFSAALALEGAISAAVMAKNASSLSITLGNLGACMIFTNEQSDNESVERQLEFLEDVYRRVCPDALLFPNTASGRELAARLAVRLGTCAITDSLILRTGETGRIRAVRPAYGGNALAEMEIISNPQIFTVRAKSYPPTTPIVGQACEIIKVEMVFLPNRMKLIERVFTKQDNQKIEDSRVIVAGGRGMSSEVGFKQLKELADLLGGMVGASRPPCDQKWVCESAQVGITGKIVAPELYIAVGISGSSQHISGCSGAKTIIALNKDAAANIFRVAQWGIVGDWKAILPVLTAKIKTLVA